MAIITLLSDFGTKDPTLAILKGSIYKELQNATIVDITHEIPASDIEEAAYCIESCYTSFPEKTVHIIAVAAEKTPHNTYIAMLLNNHYFIGTNNGVLAVLAQKTNPEQVVEINIPIKENKPNFSMLMPFVKVACHVARGGTLGVVGKEICFSTQIKRKVPVIKQEENSILATIIYIDHYGNAVTNISKKQVKELTKTRDFELRIKHYTFTKIYDSYDAFAFQEPSKNPLEYLGQKIAIYNTSGYVEIALYKSDRFTTGGAAELLGIQKTDTVKLVCTN